MKPNWTMTAITYGLRQVYRSLKIRDAKPQRRLARCGLAGAGAREARTLS